MKAWDISGMPSQHAWNASKTLKRISDTLSAERSLLDVSTTI